MDQEKIRLLKQYLDEGWSIYCACKKAKIPQYKHTEYLKMPEYKELINFYKKQYKAIGWAEACIRKKAI